MTERIRYKRLPLEPTEGGYPCLDGSKIKDRLEYVRYLQTVVEEDSTSDCVVGLGKAHIHRTAEIGSVSAGAYVRDEENVPVHFPQVGGVIIGYRVSIGAYCSVDRAAIGDTVIGDDTTLDHRVHIGHGAQIGARCIITAGAIVGGSAIVEDDCYLGLGSIILPGVIVGPDSIIGAGAVVTKDVPPGSVMVGVPAKQLVKGRPMPVPDEGTRERSVFSKTTPVITSSCACHLCDLTNGTCSCTLCKAKVKQ